MFDSFLKLIGNYIFVQACLVLFALPFYLLYRRKHIKAENKDFGFNWHMENFFSSRYANWLVFFWAAGEALAWFIIPEFLLLLLVFMRIRRKRELLYYDIYGTTAGTLAAYLIHLSPAAVAKLPYIQPSMVKQVQVWYDSHGILGMIFQPFSGVPYKVFTYLAADYHLFLPAFLIFAVLVRISRYYIAYIILSSIYPYLHKYVYRNYLRLLIAATFIFSLMLYKVYHAYGPSRHIIDAVMVHLRLFDL